MFRKTLALVAAVGISLFVSASTSLAGDTNQCPMMKKTNGKQEASVQTNDAKCSMTAAEKKEGSKAGMECCQTETKADKKAEAAEPKEVGNTTCPILGNAVGSMQKGAHVDYKGYRVGLCCNGCKAKFLKDPDANLKKAQDSVKKTEKRS